MFPDPAGLLTTAYADLSRFMAAGNVSIGSGYRVRTLHRASLAAEEHLIGVTSDGCVLEASDTEGIRRALFRIEDLMLRAQGPFLPLGTIQRRPFIKRRISRCFFGPIKRPPLLRDELMDDEDYYPEPYLDRLAHEGVNGLWLTVEFRDLCRTSITPEYGADAERRIAKLRRTVDTCLRYGIRTYVFCIEPRAWDTCDAAILRRHPQLGQIGPGGRALFCPFTDTAQRYLEEAVGGLFSRVPGLGGLINISHGERATTCLSSLSAVGEGTISCPVCATKEPWEILHAALTPMARGMHAVAPDADLISWLYMPQPQGFAGSELADWVYEIPRHTPPGVTLQFNFESGVRRQVFGKELIGGDYWLSNPGPSDRFERISEVARAAGTPVSAKIQTGCSHEVASVPFVPIPSMIYRKFAAMRRLGVSSSMLCWYFGNYPGVMNKAAGELSFEPFPESEDAFLLDLASVSWGPAAPRVAQAWRVLAEGYSHYPLTNLFQYYGPMHDGPVWPLHLDPVDAPLSPTWQLASAITREPWPPSGDRVGEAFGEALSLSQVVELCERIAALWEQGVALLREVGGERRLDRERQLDIGVAEALGIHFRSAYNILRFYQLRELMLRGVGPERLELLKELTPCIHDEIAGDQRLLELCDADSRLGFHSEAEGYKIFPAKIRWRIAQLEDVLQEAVPRTRAAILRGELLHPDYTGVEPEGARIICPRINIGMLDELVAGNAPEPLGWQRCNAGAVDSLSYTTEWFVCRDDVSLYLSVRCQDPDAGRHTARGPERGFLAETWSGYDAVALKLELRRLWPTQWFAVAANGACSVGEVGSPEAIVVSAGEGWQAALRIPFAQLGREPGDVSPMRFDVQRAVPGKGVVSWCEQHPWTPRLRLGTENPADLGWLTFN